MNTHSITISKIIHGGLGLGQLADGKWAMTRFTLPEEQVNIAIDRIKKNYVHGKLLNIIKANRGRIAPPCPYYGSCGGCDLQHAAYDLQLQIKTDVIQDLVDKEFHGTEVQVGCSVAKALASPDQFHYRQRIRLWVDEYGDCGFHRHRSHEVVAIESCMLAKPELNQALRQLREHSSFNHLTDLTSEVELLWNPESSKIATIFHYRRKPRPADFQAAAAIVKELELIESIFFKGEAFPLTDGLSKRAEAASLAVTYPDFNHDSATLRLGWEIGGFCQVNLEQNRNLIECVLNQLAVEADETVLDLFCGSGNFSIPIATRARHVLGIEGQGAAIRSARHYSGLAGLNNTEFTKSPIHQACKKLVADGASFDCLVIDPPRQGIPGLNRELTQLCRSRIVYISCDPATLCRDMGELVRSGFTVKCIQPVDMFPQTHHIETVVLLEKN
ncbi:MULTISPECIES: class I SAM-dependent RNA methyltransferase [Desulfosediminicola]|uniref:class I SAM-dependent RNA methyltransferase n=1 Tax=Desulfosediminicola TaxID=2886823 RepID=UPI0010ACBEA5|nr:class I SAM-dependent RNA methyltransferase [Desulfosediminicola ganghwensis]